MLVRVMQVGHLVCIFLSVHPNTLLTQVKNRQERGRRNLSFQFSTNPGR